MAELMVNNFFRSLSSRSPILQRPCVEFSAFMLIQQTSPDYV
jgi:hypothetical protein